MSRRAARHSPLPSPTEFGTAVRECRERAGIAQKALAAALNCSHTTVSHVEVGRCYPSFSVLVGLLEVLPDVRDSLTKEAP